MTKSGKRKNNQSATLKELVTVAFAEDIDLAEHYKEMLNDNDIPAAIKSRSNSDTSYQGIAIMVPEDYLDEAHVLIQSQSTAGDFYDMAFEDDYDSDPGIFDDNDDIF